MLSFHKENFVNYQLNHQITLSSVCVHHQFAHQEQVWLLLTDSSTLAVSLGVPLRGMWFEKTFSTTLLFAYSLISLTVYHIKCPKKLGPKQMYLLKSNNSLDV